MKAIIAQLRREFPDEDWKAQREGFQWSYINRHGDVGRWVSCMAPRYDGDDDNFISRFYIYRRIGDVESLEFIHIAGEK